MKRHLTYEDKLLLVQKVLNQPERSIKEIALAASVGNSSLQKWLKLYREGKLSGSVRSRRGNHRSHAAKMEIVLHCENKPEEYRNGYCREKGLYPEQLTQWKSELMKNDPEKALSKEKAELKESRAKIKALERELRRKDKALAEASALLILKKKAEQLFGLDDEES